MQNIWDFIIDKEVVRQDLDKVEVIRAVPKLKTFRQIRRFIGAIRYSRRFVPAFSRLAGPLIALIKKYARFKWSEDCQRFFDSLKEQLTAITLLAYSDLGWPMILYTDANDIFIGAVLNQPCPDGDGLVPGILEEVPVYFLAHRRSETQRRWPVMEKEAYTIMYTDWGRIHH